jgi:tRNA dimethylallyltransferase
VSLAGGRPLSEQWRAGRDRLRGYEAIRMVLAPPREELNRRLERRLEAMFAGGLIEETRAIRERGYGRECKPFEALGYRQALAVIEGRMSAGEALEEAKRATRQYAKRQMTWFRKEPEALWFEGFGDGVGVEEAVQAALRERLPAGFRAGDAG